MIYIADSKGKIIRTQPMRVYQGSARAVELWIFAPFHPETQVSMAFGFSDGSATPLELTECCGEITGVCEEQSGKYYSAWRGILPAVATAKSGNVSVQFYFHTGEDGEIVATENCPFTVEQGVESELPQTPSESVYEQILNNLSALALKVSGGEYSAKALSAWNSQLVYGKDEIAYDPSYGEKGGLFRSVVTDNKGNQPFKDGAVDETHWQLIV